MPASALCKPVQLAALLLAKPAPCEGGQCFLGLPEAALTADTDEFLLNQRRRCYTRAASLGMM